MEQGNHGRPLAVVVGSSISGPPEMRSTELRRQRDSLRQVDRHSSDPEDMEVSKRYSFTKSSTAAEEAPLVALPELRMFDEPDPLSNVILVVEDAELHVHKEMLASWSPVFMAMFSSSFMEKEEGKVTMHGKSLQDVRLLLNCIYPPNTCTVNSDNVMNLLPLIEEYDISALKSKCVDVIARYEPSLDVILIAHEYNMPDLLERSLDAVAKQPFHTIDHQKNTELSEHIPPKIMLDIYRCKIVNQIEQIKQYRKLRDRVTTSKRLLEQFGQSPNSYPCEKHRKLKDDCLLCLNKYRQTVNVEMEKLMLSHIS